MADDIRRRYAEALAAKFTEPIYRSDKWGENEWVENPEPADRIDQTPYVMVTAGDGRRSFWMPTCAELGEVVAAVRDEELEQLREENAALLIGADPSRVNAGKKIVDSLTRLARIERDDARADRDSWRERAYAAEAKTTVVRMMARQWVVADRMTGDAASPDDAVLTDVGRELLAALDDTPGPDRG